MDDSSGGRRWTLLDLLNWTTKHFEQSGIESPRMNAELLLAEVTGQERVMLYARFDQELGPQERARLRELVRRRASREPLQYLLGRAEFYGRDFRVTPAVMVPRPETELVVDKCLEKVAADAPELWAADIGTGSGVIAVTLACERPGLHVTATDSSAAALEVAQDNAQRHGVADRVRFVQGHLCEPLLSPAAAGGERLSLLVSNPPYIPSAQIEKLQPEVRDHEPRQALDGGPDGLRVIRELLPAAAGVLGPGGWLVLELGEGQAQAVRDIVHATSAFEPDSIQTARDGAGCERVMAARRKSTTAQAS